MIPGIHLSDIDDEIELIRLLQNFCQRTGKKVEVFFDNAPTGQSREAYYGPVKAIFVPSGRSADKAIAKRLTVLAGVARNWTVVSSDREVRNEGKQAGATILSSKDFAYLISSKAESPDHPVGDREQHGTADDIKYWLNQFDQNRSMDDE
jgi:predicted RNA-binding protein with PIN domain